MGIWDRYATLVTARRSWLLPILLIAVGGALMAGIGENDTAGSAPRSLPASSESARADRTLEQFPDADTAAAIAVVTRADGGALTESDRAAAADAVARATASGAPPADALVPAPDGAAVLASIPVPADLSGTELSDRVDRLREDARAGLPDDLVLEVTGGPAFAADISDSFAGANTTLLAVTASVVAVLLILTYRSPVLWLVPLLVIGLADRVAISVATGLARWTGLTFDGSTSGITSVLVFGAGTNYALLLVSRYRDELRREPDHRAALRQAVGRAGPAILASNLTVVTALLVLLLAAAPSTRSLGALAAAGLLVALAFVLVGLPPALALCGRRVFWPFVPRPDGTDLAERGAWHTLATRVADRPLPVLAATTALLAVCAAGLFTVDVGLSQTEQFRVRAESVDGFDTLARHFPAGASDPTVVVARSEADAAVGEVLTGTPGVVRATPTGTAPTGLTRWSVVLDAPPASDRSAELVRTLRAGLADIPDAQALVGGSDAEALDTSTTAG
ncbi:MMPL family transporter, partial [Nocardia otitidiscaviarum]